MSPPVTIRDLCAAIGTTATAQLVAAYGGTRLCVPRRRGAPGRAAFDRIAERIGEPAADALCKCFAPEVIYVPRDFAAVLAERNRAIVAGYATGKTVDDLAIEYELSCRQIQTILNRPTPSGDGADATSGSASTQGDLFAGMPDEGGRQST